MINIFVGFLGRQADPLFQALHGSVVLSDSQETVGLNGQAPLGLVQYSLHCRLQIVLAFFRLVGPTGLQVAVVGCDVVVLGQVLAQVHHFEFVAMGEHHGEVAALAQACLGRQGHPIDAARQGMSAIGLDSDGFARHLLEPGDKVLVDP